jgi:transcriptional regulator with XRE-family HTH domain
MLTDSQLAQLAAEHVEGKNKLRRARELAGLTQVQLAEKAGLTQSSLSKLEAGLYSDGPTLETLDKLAAVFGATKDLLFPMAAREEAHAE